jgi:diguanylate cyclase (GGDEF)-like protein
MSMLRQSKKRTAAGVMIALSLSIGWLGYHIQTQMQQQRQFVETHLVVGVHELNQLQREILRLDRQMALLPTATSQTLRLNIDLTQSRISIIQQRLNSEAKTQRLNAQQIQKIAAILAIWAQIKPQLEQLPTGANPPDALNRSTVQAAARSQIQTLERELNHLIRGHQESEWENYERLLQSQAQSFNALALLLTLFFLFAGLFGIYAIQFIEVRQRLLEEMKQVSTTDELTQIPNRRYFNEVFQREWNRMLRNQQSIALILCDIDFFKQYNDHYGHPAGDRCLHQVAQALASNLRRGSEFVARYGGEEFAIILCQVGPQEAIDSAERLQSYIHQLAIAHDCSQVSQTVTLSMGIAVGIPSRDLLPETVLKSADTALYQAKREGRNQTCLHRFNAA